jgi:type II secretory pathway pseudopilin PulG
MKRSRAGVTVIEAIVVVGIIVILLALLIPAVQSAREAARQVTCQNNLKQVAMAILKSESANGSLPSLYNGKFFTRPSTVSDEFHFHSWRVSILPHIEQSALYNRIDFRQASTVQANLVNIATTIPTYMCPSTNNPSGTVPEIGVFSDGGPVITFIGPAARSDYEAVLGLLPDPDASSLLDLIERARFGPWGDIRYLPTSQTATTTLTGATIRSVQNGRLRDTTDGLSQTILVGERAGRPDYYASGRLIDTYPYESPNDLTVDSQQAAWAVSTHFVQLLFSPQQTVNASNYNSLFAFHKSGVNVALVDGTVRLLSISTSTPVLNALVTRANNDLGNVE